MYATVSHTKQRPPPTFSQALTAAMYVMVSHPLLLQRPLPLQLPHPTFSQVLAAALYEVVFRPMVLLQKRLLGPLPLPPSPARKR